jgi:hypothetical protein
VAEHIFRLRGKWQAFLNKCSIHGVVIQQNKHLNYLILLTLLFLDQLEMVPDEEAWIGSL